MEYFSISDQRNLLVMIVFAMNFSFYIMYANVAMDSPLPMSHLQCPDHPTFFNEIRDATTPDLSFTIATIIEFVLAAACSMLVGVAYLTSYKSFPATIHLSLLSVRCFLHSILLIKEILLFDSHAIMIMHMFFTTCPVIPMWLNKNMQLATLRLLSVIMNTIFLPMTLLWSVDFYESQMNEEDRPYRITFVRFPQVDNDIPELDDLPTYDECMGNNPAHRDDESDNNDESYDSGYGYFRETFFLRDDEELPSYEECMRAISKATETTDYGTETKDNSHSERSQNENGPSPSNEECVCAQNSTSNTQNISKEDSAGALVNKFKKSMKKSARKRAHDTKYDAIYTQFIRSNSAPTPLQQSDTFLV